MVSLGSPASRPSNVVTRDHGESGSPAVTLLVPFIQIILIACSLALLILNGQQNKTSAFVGYLLTPLFVASALGLSRLELLKKGQLRNFDKYKSQARFNLARILAIAGCIVGMIHVYDLAWLMASK